MQVFLKASVLGVGVSWAFSPLPVVSVGSPKLQSAGGQATALLLCLAAGAGCQAVSLQPSGRNRSCKVSEFQHRISTVFHQPKQVPDPSRFKKGKADPTLGPSAQVGFGGRETAFK